MTRDLHSTMEREKAPIGVFRTKRPAAIEKEAAAVGRFHVDATDRSYTRLRILTLADPLPDASPTFRSSIRGGIQESDARG